MSAPVQGRSPGASGSGGRTLSGLFVARLAGFWIFFLAFPANIFWAACKNDFFNIKLAGLMYLHLQAVHTAGTFSRSCPLGALRPTTLWKWRPRNVTEACAKTVWRNY